MLKINNLVLKMAIICLVISLPQEFFGETVSDWLIPKPQETSILKGTWKIPQGRIICNEISNPEIYNSITELQKIFQKQGYFLPVAAIEAIDERASVKIKIDKTTFANSQSYNLNIDSTGLSITAADGAGLFYAVQTLKQIAAYVTASGFWPMVKINDWPDFE